MSTRYLLHLTYDPGPGPDGSKDPAGRGWTTDHRRAIRRALQESFRAAAAPKPAGPGEEQETDRPQLQGVACKYEELVLDAIPLVLLAGCWAILLLFLLLRSD